MLKEVVVSQCSVVCVYVCVCVCGRKKEDEARRRKKKGKEKRQAATGGFRHYLSAARTGSRANQRQHCPLLPG